MKIEVNPDGTAMLYSELGQLLGHFSDEAGAKSFVKTTYGKEHVVHKKDVKQPEDKK